MSYKKQTTKIAFCKVLSVGNFCVIKITIVFSDNSVIIQEVLSLYHEQISLQVMKLLISMHETKRQVSLL